MKSIFISVFLILSLTACTTFTIDKTKNTTYQDEYNKITDSEWENIIKRHIYFAGLEPIDYTFKNHKGSSLYIKRFHLTEKDIQIIGSWYSHGLYKNKLYTSNTNDGPGIGITFLPNKILLIFQNGYNRNGQNYYLIGNWKIIKNKIYCNIEYRVTWSKMESAEELHLSKKYVKIFQLEDYTLAFVNKKPFEFNNFDKKTKDYLFINDQDLPRYRSIQDELGGIWNKMDEKYELGYFLLSNKIKTKEDALKLVNLTNKYGPKP